MQIEKNGKDIISLCINTLHTHAVSSSVSYSCFEHLFTMELTQMVEIAWSPVAETDTNSIFKIL